jgi:hypothetical protein
MKERDELKEALASQTQRVRELEEERDNCAKAEAWRLESARRELLERERQKERERERERQKQQDKEEASRKTVIPFNFLMIPPSAWVYKRRCAYE